MDLKPIAYLLLPLLLLVACGGKQAPLGKTPEEVSRMWIDLYNKDSFDSLRIISAGQALELVDIGEGFAQEFPLEDEEPLPPVLVATMDCKENGENKATCVYCCNEGAEETLHLIKEGEQWKVTEIISDLSDIDGDFDDSGILDSLLENLDTLLIE